LADARGLWVVPWTAFGFMLPAAAIAWLALWRTPRAYRMEEKRVDAGFLRVVPLKFCRGMPPASFGQPISTHDLTRT